MSKVCFMFPGQGSQYVGMGKDFYEKSEISKKIYAMASEASGIDVEALCFEENENIHITEFTQIAIVATEVAMLKELEEKGIKADVTAGLSLGEYSALVAAGVMEASDAFKVVKDRGKFMQEAVPTGGAMSAILGLDYKIVEDVCSTIDGQVSVANYNCPGQIVITGEDCAVEAANVALKEAGAKRCLPLKVSGPFHSPMLKGAGEKLEMTLASVEVKKSEIPYITNVTADYVEDENKVKELLVAQVSSSVRWQQTIEKMIDDGVTCFVEIGPGKTLSGFMKKINKDVEVLNIEKYEDIEKVVEVLK